MKKVRFIPYVCGAGASTAGAEQGPIDLYDSGLTQDLAAGGLDLDWQENPHSLYRADMGKKAHDTLPPLGSKERKELVLWHNRHFRDLVEKTVKDGALPITIGGDHSMAAASIAALARVYNAHGRLGVLWIDAHADINTPDTSPSQALHGMPIAALLGMGDPDFAALGGPDASSLKPENICYVGLRDVDAGEAEYMKKLGIKAFYMNDIHEKGLTAIMEEACRYLSRYADHLFFDLDVDGLDPADTPATGTPVAGGIKKDEFLPALENTIKHYDFVGFEIAEYNPTLPDKETTRQTIREILAIFLRGL